MTNLQAISEMFVKPLVKSICFLNLKSGGVLKQIFVLFKCCQLETILVKCSVWGFRTIFWSSSISPFKLVWARAHMGARHRGTVACATYIHLGPSGPQISGWCNFRTITCAFAGLVVGWCLCLVWLLHG